jgi:glycosyltransferase involved in cell wall biosynthesis
VQLAGFVDDLADAYAQAAISVAPIRFGTGTRIKILESFAYACPVVSTLAGAEGIDAVPGREIELCADTIEFVSHSIRLLKDPQAREQIGGGGHALATRLYDRKAQHPRLVAMLKDFLAAHATAAGARGLSPAMPTVAAAAGGAPA